MVAPEIRLLFGFMLSFGGMIRRIFPPCSGPACSRQSDTRLNKLHCQQQRNRPEQDADQRVYDHSREGSNIQREKGAGNSLIGIQIDNSHQAIIAIKRDLQDSPAAHYEIKRHGCFGPLELQAKMKRRRVGKSYLFAVAGPGNAPYLAPARLDYQIAPAAGSIQVAHPGLQTIVGRTGNLTEVARIEIQIVRAIRTVDLVFMHQRIMRNELQTLQPDRKSTRLNS